MTKGPPLPSRDELLERIRAIAHEKNADALAERTFLQMSGVTRRALLQHFDTWGDACRAAGLGHGGRTFAELSKKRTIPKEACLAELRRVAELVGVTGLSREQFDQYASIASCTVSRRFGGWLIAIESAGLKPSDHAYLPKNPTREECILELQRVAQLLDCSYLTRQGFKKHAAISPFSDWRVFGSWNAALEASGLEMSPNFIREVPLQTLADEFLRVSNQLGRIPTIRQLTRRSRYVSHTFGSGKPGGYGGFKRRAIEHLLSGGARIAPAVRDAFDAERARLVSEVSASLPAAIQDTPHRQGRTLNFRAFAYAPTCEHDVVQMFGSVAAELGFEIVGNRSAFPDCEARRAQGFARETFAKCLIEYEFSSSDYRRHKHPPTGCDLVVCWIHDWDDCPIEVLELQAEIRRLGGWR